MEWDKEALQSIERVPFFVRRMVKKRIEELASERGHRLVMAADVHDARQRFMGGGHPEDGPGTPVPASRPSAGLTESEPAAVGKPDVPVVEVSSLANLTPEQLQQIEEAVDKIEGYENRFFSIRVCGGAAGCPLTQVDVKSIGDHLASQIDRCGLPADMRAKIQGPIFNHHRFKVAVAGCPNNCSEPQIKDYAVVAQTKPGITEEVCIECGLCVEACRDGAMSLEDGGPVVDQEKCVGCGDCIEACPTGTLAEAKKGLTVYVGGKLGRHARLATELLECATGDEAYQALDACLSLTMELGEKAERLGTLLDRVGLEELRKRLRE